MSSANFYNVYIIYMVFDESRAELRSPSSPVARRIRIPIAWLSQKASAYSDVNYSIAGLIGALKGKKTSSKAFS